jgi:hypothetical protein
MFVVFLVINKLQMSAMLWVTSNLSQNFQVLKCSPLTLLLKLLSEMVLLSVMTLSVKLFLMMVLLLQLSHYVKLKLLKLQ